MGWEAGPAIFSALKVKVRAYLRANVAVARPTAFVILTNAEGS